MCWKDYLQWRAVRGECAIWCVISGYLLLERGLICIHKICFNCLKSIFYWRRRRLTCSTNQKITTTQNKMRKNWKYTCNTNRIHEANSTQQLAEKKFKSQNELVSEGIIHIFIGDYGDNFRTMQLIFKIFNIKSHHN